MKVKSPLSVQASVEPLDRFDLLLTHSRDFLEAELCLDSAKITSVAQI